MGLNAWSLGLRQVNPRFRVIYTKSQAIHQPSFIKTRIRFHLASWYRMNVISWFSKEDKAIAVLTKSAATTILYQLLWQTLLCQPLPLSVNIHDLSFNFAFFLKKIHENTSSFLLSCRQCLPKIWYIISNRKSGSNNPIANVSRLNRLILIIYILIIIDLFYPS